MILKKLCHLGNGVIFFWFKKKKGARSSVTRALLKSGSGQTRTNQPSRGYLQYFSQANWHVPCGGEDLDKINGDLHLGRQPKGVKIFYPLGRKKSEPALPQEIIYYDLDGAICRSLNWREAQRTMLTEKTTNAILVI